MRVLYAVPADREFSSDTRRWDPPRRSSMCSPGITSRLGGVTFSLRDPIVEDCRLSQPEDFYGRGHAWNKVVEAVQHCAPVRALADGGTS